MVHWSGKWQASPTKCINITTLMFQICPNIRPKKGRKKAFPLHLLTRQVTVQEGVVGALLTGGISSPMIKDVISRWVLILLLKDWKPYSIANDWVKGINSTLMRSFISSFKNSLLVFPFSIHTKFLLSSVQWP